MIGKINNIPFLLLLLILVGCTTNPPKKSTYFGGKIINPKSKFVILYQMEKAMDTFFLDTNNKFLSKIDINSEGIYYFKYGPEFQFLYLHPQDSLLIRLNTWDFDGSLVFSGKGAARNNMLIDCFLEAEKDNHIFHNQRQLSPTILKRLVDSIKILKLEKYANFIEHNPNESKGFKEVLKIALTFPLYNKLEKYPISHKKCGKSHTKELAELTSFYEHRKKIDINKDSLMYFYAYSRYVTNYLYNLAYEKTHNFSSEFTKNLLYIINDKIKSEKTRNELLNQTIISHFYNQSSCTNYTDVFFTFFKLNTSIQQKKEVQRLLNDTKLVKTGEKIDDFLITDFSNSKQSIKQIIKGTPSFLLFWNSAYVSPEFVATRINFLQTKYPKIKFIQIKINGNIDDKIKKLDIKTQFFIDSLSDANAFLTSKFPRTILVNKKGIIANGFASLNSRKIHKQLANLQKE